MVLEKDNENAFKIKIEVVKLHCSEIEEECHERFKKLSDSTLKNNLNSWAEEASCFKRKRMLCSLSKLKEMCLMKRTKIKKEEG